MFRLKLVRNLRTAVWLFFVALIPIGISVIYWANKTGLPDEWRAALEQEISKHGAHVELGSLRYIPLKGFVATDVRVFAEEERINETSRLERVQLVVDYSSLAKGEFRLRKVELRNADLCISVDPKNPAGESMHITGIYGTVFMPNDRLIEIRNTKGTVGGMKITLNAKLLGRDSGKNGPEEEKREGKRREFIAHIINELEHWDFDPEDPPKVQIELEGQLADKESIKAKFNIQASSAEKNMYRLNEIVGSGTLSANLLTISTLTAEDSRGNINGHFDYQISNNEGRFDIESSIDVPRLLRSWFSIPFNLNLLSGGNQQFVFAGTYDLKNISKPVVNLTGHALCESVMFRGVSFDKFESWFSWQDGDFLLRDIKLQRPDGKAEGKVLKEDNIVRLKLVSTLPPQIYKPFFKGKPLEKVISDFSANENASCDLIIEGLFDLEDRYAWAFSGNGKITNTSYRGVPINSANCSFSLNRNELDFYDGKIDFDYSDYALRKTYNGPTSGRSKIGRIRYDRKLKVIEVEGVEGDIWASPMIRLFSENIADSVEKYRFHRPPTLTGSGIVDVTKQGRTDLTVSFKSSSRADYKFLGKDIILSNSSAKVHILNKKISVSDLDAKVFGGAIVGKFIYSGDSQLMSEVSWSKIGVKALSSTYGFNVKGGGDVTGRIEFTMESGDVSTMRGKGLMAMENAELFSIPIFGPLSTIVSKVLGDKLAGLEKAKSAFCTFNISNGVLTTTDIQTSTNSVVVAGDGSVDLADKTFDITIRLNARGLLGIITLPLRPFAGLFQFRGTGQLSKPEWENVHFTSPPELQNKILLAKPPKAKVISE